MSNLDEWRLQTAEEYTIKEMIEKANGYEITHIDVEKTVPPTLHAFAPRLTHLSLRDVNLNDLN